MKKKTNLPRNIAFFAILIIFTFYILLKDQNVFDIINIIKNADLKFVLIGIFCMFIYLVLEGVNIRRTLKILGEKTTLRKNLKYAFIGFFFSSITPAASGGQPMQVYYMYKDKISVSKSTLALLINLTSMQIVTISFALISLFFNYQYLNKILIICFIVGITLNLSALVLLLISILSKRMTQGLINLVIKILKLLKVKNIEEKRENLQNELEKYQESAIYIKQNKALMIKTIMTTLVQFIFYYSITYWVYRALGFGEATITQIITMQSVLYATVSGIPSPGAVGVSEGAFMEIFKNVYPEAIMSSAVLLNRGINFYLFVLICSIITIVNHVRMPKSEENMEEEEKQ